MMKKFKIPNIENEKTVLKTIRIKYSLIEKINECIEYALKNLNIRNIK